MRFVLGLAIAAGATSLLSSAALAHVTLSVREVAVGSYYRATFTVPHGCKGSATVKVSVQIPTGVISVKPQLKPGWKVEVVKGTYDEPYQLHGSKITEGVKVVTWSGGNLPDENFDEFALQAYIDKSLSPGKRLYFPVVQTCEQGVERWIEIPAEGKSTRDYRYPAPSLKLLPAVETTD